MKKNSSRREFLVTISALVPAVSMVAGCSGGLLATYEYQGLHLPVTLHLPDYPELLVDGGAIQLKVKEEKMQMIIVRVVEGQFTALSPVCTHLGCMVKKESGFFRCPCHGSTFSLDGVVVRGPAEHSLTGYTTKLSNETLEIYV